VSSELQARDAAPMSTGHWRGGSRVASVTPDHAGPQVERANATAAGERTAAPPGGVVPVLVKRLDVHLPLPARAHAGDAGVDLVAAADVTLAPGERAVVPTGIAIALPAGYAAFVHPRSGLAAHHGITIVNAPGTVDAGYRGEIRVTLLNTDRAVPVTFSRGDRIAQLVIQRVENPAFCEVDALPGSARGEGGFGSTGGHSAGDAREGQRPAGAGSANT
jgi:dUTP pyrophosphatase